MKKESIAFDWKEYSLKGIAGVLIGFAVLLLLFFIVACLIYFPPRGMSSSLQNLGLYGDYFGGIVGGITSIATLGVTIYLALALHRLEKENNESSIEAQRKITILQLKFQEVANFNTLCNDGFNLMADFQSKYSKIILGHTLIMKAVNRLERMFPELSDERSEIDLTRMLEPLGMVTIKRTILRIHLKPEYESISSEESKKKILSEMAEYYSEGWNAFGNISSYLSQWVVE